jgi:D-3-phosphoglycerate dehydrogenase
MRNFSSRILCSDPIDPVATDILQKAGFSVEQVDATKMSEDDLLAMVPTFDGLIVRRSDLNPANFRALPNDFMCSGTTVSPKLIDAASNLKLVGRAGVGIDNIDLDAATRK